MSLRVCRAGRSKGSVIRLVKQAGGEVGGNALAEQEESGAVALCLQSTGQNYNLKKSVVS